MDKRRNDCQKVCAQCISFLLKKNQPEESGVEHISSGLKKSHWLPIKYRIEFKVLTIVSKSLHDEAPTYISDLLELKKSSYSLRSANGINLQEQRSKLKYYGDRAFSVCAP